jgi:hypothetical protein
MTLSSMISADVADVFLNTDDFADTVRRYRNGDLKDGADFVAVVTISGADTSEHVGRGTIVRASLVCAESIDIRATDKVRHNGIDYEVENVGDAEHGMRTVSMVRYSGEFRGAKSLRNGDL